MHPHRTTRTIVYGFGLILAAGIGSSGALVVVKQFTSPPRLDIADSELDFGERFESVSHEHQFYLVNPTDSPILVSGLSGNCDCQGWTPDTPFSVPPRGKHEIRVRLALSASSDCARIRGSEQLVIPIRVMFAGPSGVAQSQVWKFHGLVRPVLRANDHLALGMQTAGQLAVDRVIELTAAEFVEAVSCQAPTHWAITVRNTAEGSGRFTASLRFVGPPTPVLIDDTVVFTPIRTNGQPLPSVRVRITGELVGDIVTSPRSVYFGRHPVGSIIEETIALKSLSGKPFVVHEVVPRIAGCTAEKACTESSDAVWMIRQTVAAVGQQAGELEFVVDEGTGADIRVVVPVTYLGVE